jgi:streptomycin 6-kinase
MVAIPDHILANWREWYPETHERVAADVGDRTEAAIEAWELEGASAFGTGEVALVLEANRDGTPVVCKLSPPDPSLGDEAKALASWGGICPALLDSRDRGLTMLLERLDPGTPLAFNVGSVDEELRVIGALARRLHDAPAPEVPRLAGSALAQEWSEALPDPADRAELERLLEADDVVIHSDLHANNVMRHGGEWRVIDPKPFRASREAEVWGLVDGTGLEGDGAAEEMRRRLEIYCEAAGLEPALTHRWARLRARSGVNLASPGSTWRRELAQVAAALA